MRNGAAHSDLGGFCCVCRLPFATERRSCFLHSLRGDREDTVWPSNESEREEGEGGGKAIPIPSCPGSAQTVLRRGRRSDPDEKLLEKRTSFSMGHDPATLQLQLLHAHHQKQFRS